MSTPSSSDPHQPTSTSDSTTKTTANEMSPTTESTLLSPVPLHYVPNPENKGSRPSTPQIRHTPEPSKAKQVAPSHIVEHHGGEAHQEREQDELEMKMNWLQHHVGEEEAEKRLNMKPVHLSGVITPKRQPEA